MITPEIVRVGGLKASNRSLVAVVCVAVFTRLLAVSLLLNRYPETTTRLLIVSNVDCIEGGLGYRVTRVDFVARFVRNLDRSNISPIH